ncbi:hypothetical protein QFZ94_008889 [Paraburkholderia sp. JPY465]|uniref:hypothetical protein n=1 Tax=Paraburkholderia sp. JPY465 TaxID=3042285 RepID=UPI003D20CFE5
MQKKAAASWLCSAGHGCSWLQTQLGIFDANGLAEAVPQIHEVRDNHALALLRFGFARQ